MKRVRKIELYGSIIAYDNYSFQFISKNSKPIGRITTPTYRTHQEYDAFSFIKPKA